METRVLINDFAIRSFRDVADGDYVTARLAHRANLIPQFLWSSLQALEKYLKCILLLNRIEAKRMGHDLGFGLKKIDRHAPFKLKLSDVTIKFVEYLDTFGRHRYFETPYYTKGLEIVFLDKAVWEIRRYCTALNYSVARANGGIREMLPIELMKIEKSDENAPQTFKLNRGVLEKIVADDKHPARAGLIWQNAFYGKRARKMIRVWQRMQGANSPLSLHPEILDEVQKFVFIPRDVANHYREQKS